MLGILRRLTSDVAPWSHGVRGPNSDRGENNGHHHGEPEYANQDEMPSDCQTGVYL